MFKLIFCSMLITDQRSPFQLIYSVVYIAVLPFKYFLMALVLRVFVTFMLGHFPISDVLFAVLSDYHINDKPRSTLMPLRKALLIIYEVFSELITILIDSTPFSQKI